MKFRDNLPKYLVIGFFLVGAFVLGARFIGNGPEGSGTVVAVPVLSADAKQGGAQFERFCAACHGKNASGSDQGPPLVHKIYEPGHHADQSFILAAKTGVRAHHWRFGNMPPVPGVTEQQIILITRYVRELQRANGIN